MTTTLDELMRINPLELTDQNLDDLISYHRKNRERIQLSGGKGRAKIAKPEGAKKKIDLSTLKFGEIGMSAPKVKEPALKRRF